MLDRLETTAERQVRELAVSCAAEHGLELVDLAIRRGGKSWKVRVDIDRVGPAGATLDACQRVSRSLACELNALKDRIPDSYTLEVSTPGIDRPIRSDEDIRRNEGRPVIVSTTSPILGKNRWTGTLLGQADGQLRLAVDGHGEVLIPRNLIAVAKQDVGF